MKEIVKSLTRENENLKQENKTFLKVIELMHKKDDNDTNKIEQTIQKEIPWNVVKTNANSRSPGKANQVKTQVELRNRFQYLQREVETEVGFNIEEPNVEVINNSTRKRHNKNNNNNQHRRPNICTTENYLLNEKQPFKKKQIRSGMRTYADSTKFGKKILITGDSHLKRIKRNKLKNSFKNTKCIMKTFGGAKTEELEHYKTPHLEYEKLDIVVIHVGSNNINYNNLNMNLLY